MDALDRLAFALYGRAAKPSDWVGGSTARILLDAAERIEGGAGFSEGRASNHIDEVVGATDYRVIRDYPDELPPLTEDQDDPHAECNNPERIPMGDA